MPSLFTSTKMSNSFVDAFDQRSYVFTENPRNWFVALNGNDCTPIARTSLDALPGSLPSERPHA